jgi:hypothetical protein
MKILKVIFIVLKKNASKFTLGVPVKNTPGIGPRRAFPGRCSVLYQVRGATACRGPGAEIRSPKSCDAAELGMVGCTKYFCCSFVPFEQQLLPHVLPRHHTNPIPPLTIVTPGFRRGKKKEYIKYICKTPDF